MGKRFTASVNTETDLTFEFSRSGSLLNAYYIVGVSIFATEVDANSDANALFNIDVSSISNPSTGVYTYKVPVIASAGTYYDKVRLIPVEGEATISFVNSFIVYEYAGSGGKPVDMCLITGSLVDSGGNPISDEVVNFVAQGSPAVDTNTLNGVAPVSVQAYTNSNGRFEIPLIKGIEYRVNIRAMGYSGVLKVPTDVSTAVLWSLVTIGAVTTTTPPSGGGNENPPSGGGSGNNW